MSIKFSGITALLGLGIVLNGGRGRAADEPKVGDKAPDFSLKGSDGKTYSLADFKGKKAVVIAWFPKAFTGGCTAECKSFKANSDGPQGDRTSPTSPPASTSPRTNTKFAESLGLRLPDPERPGQDDRQGLRRPQRPGDVANRWTFYIDKDGVINEIDKKVNTKAEAGRADVAAKIKSLGLGK